MMTKEEKTFEPAAVPFEEALALTGFGVYNILTAILGGVLMMAIIFETFANSFLVVASACELGTNATEQGILAAMPTFGSILTSHFWGYIADKHGRRKTALISLSLGFIVGILGALSPNWIVLAILKLITCSILSSLMAISVTLVGESSPVRWRKLVVIAASGMFVFSIGIMAAITIPVLSLKFSDRINFLNVDFQPWRLLSMILTSPCLVGAIGVYFSCESPKFLLSVGREEEALDVLKTIFIMNKKKSSEEFKVKSVYLDQSDLSQNSAGLWASVKEQTMPLFEKPLLYITLQVMALTVIVYTTTSPAVIWFPTMAQKFTKAVARGDNGGTFCEMINYENNNISTARIDEPIKCSLNQPAMLMMFGVFFVYGVLNLILGVFVDILGRRRLMICTNLIAGICGVCLVFVKGIIPNAAIYIIYMCSVLNASLSTTVAVDAFPTCLRAMGVGLSVMMGRAAAVVAINILKQLMVNYCNEQFYLFAGVSLAGVVICYFLPKDAPVSKSIKN